MGYYVASILIGKTEKEALNFAAYAAALAVSRAELLLLSLISMKYFPKPALSNKFAIYFVILKSPQGTSYAF